MEGSLPATKAGRIISVDEMIAGFQSRGIHRWTADAVSRQQNAHENFATLGDYIAAQPPRESWQMGAA